MQEFIALRQVDLQNLSLMIQKIAMDWGVAHTQPIEPRR